VFVIVGWNTGRFSRWGATAGVFWPNPGIAWTSLAPVLQARVADLAGQTIRVLGTSLDFQAEAVQVNADYIGAGCCAAAEPEREFLEPFAGLEDWC
jgi:hypothetical protein